jgi:hypothetical protein
MTPDQLSELAPHTTTSRVQPIEDTEAFARTFGDSLRGLASISAHAPDAQTLFHIATEALVVAAIALRDLAGPNLQALPGDVRVHHAPKQKEALGAVRESAYMLGQAALAQTRAQTTNRG